MNPWLIDMLQEYGCREIVVTQPEHKSEKKTDRREAAFLSNLPGGLVIGVSKLSKNGRG